MCPISQRFNLSKVTLKKSLMIGSLILGGSLLSGCGSDTESTAKSLATPAMQTQDLKLFHGGNIITMETEQPQAEAVVARAERIVYVGDKAGALEQYGQAQLIDLLGDTMMPGLIEQHLHPFLGALTLSMPVIAPEAWELPDKTWPAVAGQQAYLKALRDAEAQLSDPEETLWSWGYHQMFHGDISRAQLDKISSTRPIVVWHRSCHEFYGNSAFIDKFKIDQASVDAAGSEVSAQIDLEKGHFYEAGAMIYLLPRIQTDLANPARFKAGLEQMVEILHTNGVTAFNEPGALIDKDIAQLYRSVLGAQETPMYSFFTPESKTPYYQHGKEGVQQAVEEITRLLPETGKVRFFDKQVKILFDGAIISQLMMMQDGYLDGHHGEWIQNPEEVEAVSKIFWDAGYQILVHVNGDEGLEQLIGILERRMAENPREDHRFTVIHFANSTEAQVKRLAELGAIVSANPYYVTGFSDKYSEIGLGPERAQAMVRLSSAVQAGMPVSLHSDLPMAPADPLFLAWTAVNRYTNNGNIVRPDLALSVDQAMRAITIDAAHSWQMEDQLGSIRVGKIANFTILKESPYEVAPMRLKDIDISSTVFEGRLYPLPQDSGAD